MGGLNINIFSYIPWSGIGYIELLLLYFGEISIPNSTVGASFFTGPSNKQGFFIPYAPTELLSFVFLVLDILWQWWDGISYWFHLCIWWIRILNTLNIHDNFVSYMESFLFSLIAHPLTGKLFLSILNFTIFYFRYSTPISFIHI